jgi:hypothetical protein
MNAITSNTNDNSGRTISVMHGKSKGNYVLVFYGCLSNIGNKKLYFKKKVLDRSLST